MMQEFSSKQSGLQPKASSKMVIPHKGYTNWQYLFKTRGLLNPTLSCPLICLPQSYLTVDITQNMYQEGERTPDDESSLTFRNKVNKGKLAYSSRRPITQKEPINKGNVAIVVGAVLIVAFLVYQLSVVGSRRAQSVKNDPCSETEEALQKQQEKVKTMMVAIDSLKSQLQASKRHVSQQQATLTPSVKSGTVAKPTATSSAVSGQQMKPGYVSKGAKGAPAHLQNPQIVIDIEYPEKDYLPLPVDFFRKNEQGKTLPEVLYADAEQRKKREDYQRQRITFMDGKSNYPQVFLTKYNMPLTEDAAKEGREANVKEWVRLNSKFGFDKVKTELPMCIMVPGYNNNANFRIEYNLNSIFSQNYTNYKVVVIDDKSSDGSGGVYRNYFAFHRIDKSRYTYIQNSKRVTALQNIYMGSLNHCPEDSIVVTIDADDEFIGRNVLQVFNWGYQTKKAGVLYTNFMWYQHRATLMYGFTSDYSQTVKKNNAFRSTPMQFSHLRSYRNQLIGQIDPKDLQDDKGEFFTITYDIALFIPLMELSCGRVYKVDGEYHYLYNTGTGLNDYNDRGRQVQVENKIRGRKRYECYQEFDKRMRQ